MFRKYQGIKLPYKQQGLIYFVCLNYAILPEAVKRKILNLCLEVANEHYKALFELLTDGHKTASLVSSAYSVSKTKLNRMRKEFYEKWNL